MNIKEYTAKLPADSRKLVMALSALVMKAVPDAEAAIKWGQPVFSKGGPFCYIKPAKSYVNIGFWRGTSLKDPGKVLQGDGDKMRHVKIHGPADLKEKVLRPLIRQSADANQKRGDPTKNKP
jgi:hypothetical protein